MDDIYLPPLERRHRRRYGQMVQAHLQHSPSTAAGPKDNAPSASALATTQAAWRFLDNDDITLEALTEPLLEAGCDALAQKDDARVPEGDALTLARGRGTRPLLVHDWSKLAYPKHRTKRDLAQLTHEMDMGYDLSSALLVSGVHGSPLAPMQMHLRTAEAIHSTSPTPPGIGQSHLEQVGQTMAASRQWGLPRAPVHVIDREADSVGDYRQWDQDGHKFLVRGDDRLVLWEGKQIKLSQIVQTLESQEKFTSTRKVNYHGKPRRQYVAGATVTLHRPAKRRVHGRQQDVPGEPLILRLVVAQVRRRSGGLLASWLLLTNVPEDEASAATVALWYYWRWRIESFFKLLKSGGHQVERWGQQRGLAIARRLLIAAMACVVVWQLQSSEAPEVIELKTLLVRLSGRATKRTRPFTDSALLAGLFVLLPMLDLLETYNGDLTALRRLAQQHLPFVNNG